MMQRTNAAVIFLVLMVIGWLLYANALDNGFHYDDQQTVVDNKEIRDASNFAHLWTTVQHPGDAKESGHYRPLLLTSYMANYAWGGLSPIGYHLVDVAIHIVTAFLVAAVLASLTGMPMVGILGGLLFLVHPINSEAVNYIAARSSTMYALFFMLAFYGYLRFRPPDASERGDTTSFIWVRPSARLGPRVYLVLSLMAFMLSMLSKEMAVTFPLIILFYEEIFRRPALWKDRIRAWGVVAVYFIAVILPYLAARYYFFGANLTGPKERDLTTQMASQMKPLIQTIGLYLWPVNLTPYHSVELENTFVAWPVAGYALLLTGILGLIIVWSRSKYLERRTFAFLMGWFFVTLLPVIIIPLNMMLQENRSYLAGFGLIGGMAYGVAMLMGASRSRSRRLRGVIWVAVGGIIIVYGMMTVHRNSVWKDDISLWSDAVTKAPYSVAVRTNLGSAYERQGHLEAAAEQYQHAWKINPSHPIVLYNLGAIREKQGRLSEARAWFTGLIRILPGTSMAYVRLGQLDEKEGNLDRAIQRYREVVRVWPDKIAGHRSLADALVKKGHVDDAIREYERVFQLVQSDPKQRSEVLTKLLGLREKNGK